MDMSLNNKRKKQNILHLTSVFGIGGMERVVANLVQYISQDNRHYLAILRSSTEGLKLLDREIKVQFYQGLNDSEIDKGLRDYINENSINTIIAHNRHSLLRTQMNLKEDLKTRLRW